MKLYLEAIKLLFSKFVLRKNTGVVIKQFCEKMGIVYIKFAQMLAMQNYGNYFTEEDRKELEDICDDCNKISYDEIEQILREEYGKNLENIFRYIEKDAIGSASISQVHKAILKNGEEVVIKVKRKDVAKTVDRDIERIKKFVHRFGKFAKVIKFGNYTGSDQTLNLFSKWIQEETDFVNEIKNIKTYQEFADSVNNKVKNTKQIKLPKLYEDYCTDNVIVMEYIASETVKKMELTDTNKSRVIEGINSYLKLSFYALFNDKKIVFHGDPHSANIYIDENGNIGFLDMGLVFSLSEEEHEMIKTFFLTAYARNYEKLYDFFVGYGSMDDRQKELFKADCKKYCDEIIDKDITHYFTDWINICIKYEFVPPNYLFCMAKAFICLTGINTFTHNRIDAIELLKDQTIEFLLQRSSRDLKNIGIHVRKLIPNFPKLFMETLNYGLVKTIAKESSENPELSQSTVKFIQNLREMRNLYEVLYSENEIVVHDAKEKVKV